VPCAPNHCKATQPTTPRAQPALLGSAAHEDRQAEGAGRFGVRRRVAAFVRWRDASRQSKRGHVRALQKEPRVRPARERPTGCAPTPRAWATSNFVLRLSTLAPRQTVGTRHAFDKVRYRERRCDPLSQLFFLPQPLDELPASEISLVAALWPPTRPRNAQAVSRALRLRGRRYQESTGCFFAVCRARVSARGGRWASIRSMRTRVSAGATTSSNVFTLRSEA